MRYVNKNVGNVVQGWIFTLAETHIKHSPDPVICGI